MELNEYQEKAMSTCMESCDNFSYMMLNLVGEVGEFASKVAKQIRKDNWCILDNFLCDKEGTSVGWDDYNISSEVNKELMKEAGDCLWQLAGLCHAMGWKLNDVAQQNLDKLQARKKAGTIDGSGDGIIRGK